MARVVHIEDFRSKLPKIDGRVNDKELNLKVEKSSLVFANEYKKLKKLIGSKNKDYSASKSSIVLARALLTAVVKMIPIAEKAYHKSPGQSTAFSFTALVNLARELQSDIRNLVDLQKQADAIVENIIQPNLILIVQSLVNETYTMRKEFKRKIKRTKSRKVLKELSDDYLRTQSKYMNTIKSAMTKQIHSYLVEAE